jgi:hypothetical protein
MSIDREQFEIRTLDGEFVCSLSGRLRDLVFEIHRRLGPVHQALSALAGGSGSNATLTVYHYPQGPVQTVRYLLSNSGDEFENWADAERHADGWLPGEQWRIGAQFLPFPTPGGIVGHAILEADPSALPAIDFARESGTRRAHYGHYSVDVKSWKLAGYSHWAASFELRSEDGRKSDPLNIGAMYENRDDAISAAFSHAETMIDNGITLQPVTPGVRPQDSSTLGDANRLLT